MPRAMYSLSTSFWTVPRNFSEGTPWHYNFMVPHDAEGLAARMGKDMLLARAEQAGFEAHFVKPVALAKLLTEIEMRRPERS